MNVNASKSDQTMSLTSHPRLNIVLSSIFCFILLFLRNGFAHPSGGHSRLGRLRAEEAMSHCIRHTCVHTTGQSQRTGPIASSTSSCGPSSRLSPAVTEHPRGRKLSDQHAGLIRGNQGRWGIECAIITSGYLCSHLSIQLSAAPPCPILPLSSCSCSRNSAVSAFSFASPI